MPAPWIEQDLRCVGFPLADLDDAVEPYRRLTQRQRVQMVKLKEAMPWCKESIPYVIGALPAIGAPHYYIIYASFLRHVVLSP